MYKNTRGAGGGRVPRKLSAAGFYWSGTRKAARSLAPYDPRDDEEPPGKISAPNTVPVSEVVRRNREIEQQLPSNVGKAFVRKKDKISNRQVATGAPTHVASTLYVGNLGWRATHYDLTDVFSEAGKVLSSQIICDRKTNRSRGFGFVEMESDAAADAAIAKLNGRDLKGRIMRVKRAQPRQARDGDDHKAGKPIQEAHRPHEATAAAKNPRVVSRGEIGAPNRVESRASQAQQDARRRSKTSWKPARRRKGKNVPEWKNTFRWQSDV